MYLSDPFQTPVEVINGARLARNLQAANLCGTGLFDNILSNLGCDGYAWQPSIPPALNDAVLWLDAMDGAASREIAPNRGTGGQALNGTLGAATTVGTDQPLWLGGTEKYLYTPAVSGNSASLVSIASFLITGDIEIVLRLSMDDWTPASVQTVFSKYAAATAGYEVQVNTDGTIRFVARLAASDITVASTIALPAVDGQTYWIKVSRIQSTGVVSFYYAQDSVAEPPAYNQLGTSVTSTTGVMTSGAQALTLGERTGGTQSAAGKLFRAMMRNSVAASTPANVLDVDFTANSSQSSFTATTGGTVTIARSTTGRKSVVYLGRPLWLFGADDFINVPDNNLIDFAANESLTVIAIQRVHNVAVGAVQGIVADQTSSAAQGFGLYNGTAATSSMDIHDGSVSIIANTGNKVASSLHVVGGIRDVTADTVTAYLDGTAGTPVADTTTATLNNAQPLRIGSFSGGGTPLDAEIMAVMVWRRALTAAEMTQVSAFYKGVPQIAGRCWTTVDFSAGSNPWYDARLPESTEAYGFVVEEWTGLDGAHHVRTSMPTGANRGGAYYGPQSHSQRVWKLNVLLHSSTERGAEYLFRWLESKLLNCCGSLCDTQFAWIRQVCPSDPEQAPQEGVARAERVVLLEGPTWEAQPTERGGCYLRRASFTLGVGDPCLYREAEPLAFAEVTTTGTGTGNTLSNCATFAGNQRQVKARLTGPPGYGLTAPVVTITSPAQTILSTRAGLPVMRIAGYLDPQNTGDPCRSLLIGELILEGFQSSGYEIVVDMAKRKIRMRAIGGAGNWLDGSRLIGRALRAGLTRWWSFGPCDSGLVVVEPAFTNLETARSGSTATQVTGWSVRVESEARIGCC